MTDQTSIERTSPPPSAAPDAGRCRYCGAKLNAFFYFCVACGTPYKDAGVVLPRSSPPVVSEADLIDRKAPGAARLFWAYFSVVVGGGVFALVMFQEDRPDLRMLLQQALIFIVTCVFAILHWPTLRVQLARFGFDKIETWIALLLLCPLLLVNYAQFHLLKGLGAEFADNMIRTQLRGLGYPEAALVVMFCVFPAITEEIGFRGLLQHWLQVAIKPWRALALAAFLFAVVHLSVITLPYLFVVGLLLGWTKWKTGSLYPAILIHFLHNFFVIEFFAASE
jgi:membrane protease YdiL (CAAX protease family)